MTNLILEFGEELESSLTLKRQNLKRKSLEHFITAAFDNFLR